MTMPEKIPVFLLSGFLGAGKSTLLNQLLEDPAFHDTAVVINEFGDVPVDHLLVRRGETTISQVSTGCLCCTGNTNISKTLFDLHFAGVYSATGKFSRVIVEMSGLGDPAPLVNALTKSQSVKRSELDKAINNIFYLAGFVTLYDVINGADTLDRHFEALKQIAFADKIVLSKTDLLDEETSEEDQKAISQGLSEINHAAEISDRTKVTLTDLFQPRSYSILQKDEDVLGWLALEEAISADPDHASHQENGEVTPSRHGTAIRTFSIVFDKPTELKRLHQFLTVLQTSAGARLLRVKGIVATKEAPDHPLVIHAVQHLIADPYRLDTWPDDDRRTRLVFITNGVEPKPVRELFSAIIENNRSSDSSLFQRLSRRVAGLFQPTDSKSKV
ncbi:MAG: GTP-binding protein [Rhizobiaceae bacterium]|nr:GTP-binding protein [Rhizobiaceae bacterium]